MKSPLVSLLILLTAFYLTITAILFFTQSYFIFFPREISGNQHSFLKQFKSNEITLDHDGISLHGWFIQNEINPENPLITEGLPMRSLFRPEKSNSGKLEPLSALKG